MMNSILVLTVLFLEVIMVLQCLQIAFKKEVYWDKYTVGMVLIDVSLYMLINMRMVPAICALALYILLFIYCYIEYKQTIMKTMVGFIVGFILVGCIEGTLTFICSFVKNSNNSNYILLLLNIVGVIITYCLKRIVLRLKIEKTIAFNRELIGLTVLLGISIIVLLIDYYCFKKIVNIYVVGILCFLVTILFYLYRLEFTKNEIKRKNYELELQRVYGETYKDLISNVRKRQHDFKNQLGTMFSMHLVATSLDELIDMQNEYREDIRYDSKYDSILVNCNNPILAGFLYHRCLLCEKENISVNYSVHIDQLECCFQLHEIIEILGILIDNACESFISNSIEYKQIEIKCLETDREVVLCVANPYNYVTYSNIEKMFSEGFSTKGNDRGIGLPRVLELTKKYNAELRVTNNMINGLNWIKFHIIILK